MNKAIEEIAPYVVDPTRALQVLGVHLFADPRQFVRELVSNAIDAYRPQVRPGARVEVAIDVVNSIMTFRDSGKGMSATEMRRLLPSFFSSSKGSGSSEIGGFGIGLYAALKYARRVDVLSCQDPARGATVATLGAGSAGVGFADTSWDITGTQVTVHLCADAPALLLSESEIFAYLSDVFALASVDIFLNRVLAAGPSRWDPPWNPSALRPWSPEFAHPVAKGQRTPRLLHLIQHDEPRLQCALFIYANPRPDWRMWLSVRGVMVAPLAPPAKLASLADMLSGIVECPEVPLTLSRGAPLPESAAYADAMERLHLVVVMGLVAFAETAPSGFRTFALTQRESLLEACGRGGDLATSLANHLPFRTLSGAWKSPAEVLAAGPAFWTVAPSRGYVKPGTSDTSAQTLVLTTPGELVAFQSIKHSGAWTQVDAVLQGEVDEFYFFAQQAKAVLNDSKSLVRSPSNQSLAADLANAVQSAVIDVRVRKDERDSRPAYILPQPKTGVDVVAIEERVRAQLEGQEVPGSNGYKAQFRRTFNNLANDQILILNLAHPVVVAFFAAEADPAPQARDLCRLLMLTLAAIARQESYADWPIWTSSFRLDSILLTMLSSFILDVTGHLKTSERK